MVRGIDVNGRGKLVNGDIPDEERRAANAKKVTKAKREKKKADNTEKQEELTGFKKRDAERDRLQEKRRSKTVEEKRAKKKKRKTAGELIESGKGDKVTQRLSKFEEKALAVASQIQNAPSTIVNTVGENEFLAEYQNIFSSLQNIIGKMNKSMDEKDFVSSKDVYALCTLFSSMRETIADMRSIRDMNGQAEMLRHEILEPTKRSIGEVLASGFFKLVQVVRQNTRDEDLIRALTEGIKLVVAEQGVKAQTEFDHAASRIINVLNGGK